MKPVQNKAVPMPTTPAEYIQYELECNFRVGERVRICRSSPNYEGGWNNSWNSQMNSYVGRTHAIKSVGHANGSGIGIGGFRFPYFILERIIGEEDTNV